MQLSKHFALAVASFSFLGSAYGAPGMSSTGRLPVPHNDPENSLFFWLFEAEDTLYDDNLIWFNGGPGCSSLIGLTTGNGPISFDGNTTRTVANPYSWTKFGHGLNVDQPVGTGYATASEPYPAVNNGVVTTHFYNWLQSFFAHFPHLQAKQLHLFGESWAVNAPAISATIEKYLASHQALLQIPDDILDVFTEASKTCGFDDVLEEAAQFPPRHALVVSGNPEGGLIYDAIHSSCYGPCATFSTASSYLDTHIPGFDLYDITHDRSTTDHSPWSRILGSDRSKAPMDFILPGLVTSHNIFLHVYFGEYGFLLNHFSASSVSTDEAGKWASECGVTYHFFRGAGHSVFLSKPREMFAYVRDGVVAKSSLSDINTN
ncbi:Alpha/Beta hydrolase protein [Aspergillus filifer]